MRRKDFCGCCSLKGGGMFTGMLATVYNAALFYWFFNAWQNLHSVDELFLVLRILLEVLMFLAAVHSTVSIILIYAVIKFKPDLVMLWIVTYIASCCVVAGLFTIGLAFMLNKIFLYIILFNLLFIFNVVMTFRLYKEMVENIKRESI